MRNEWKASKMSEMIEFTAQLFVDIGKRDAQIRKALQVLQNAQRYDVQPQGDYYHGEGMVHRDNGDYVNASDVSRAIQILREEE